MKVMCICNNWIFPPTYEPEQGYPFVGGTYTVLDAQKNFDYWGNPGEYFELKEFPPIDGNPVRWSTHCFAPLSDVEEENVNEEILDVCQTI